MNDPFNECASPVMGDSGYTQTSLRLFQVIYVLHLELLRTQPYQPIGTRAVAF